MKLFVGLGNPGTQYANTRHNVGFMLIDYIASLKGLTFNEKFYSHVTEFISESSEKIILAKPQTFMNDSGKAVSEIMRFYKIPHENVFIAFDDLDIRYPEYKIQKSKYPKVHNGINDILEKTGKSDFTFIRIGVDNRTNEERKVIQGSSYVLQKMNLDFDKTFALILEDLSRF